MRSGNRVQCDNVYVDTASVAAILNLFQLRRKGEHLKNIPAFDEQETKPVFPVGFDGFFHCSCNFFSWWNLPVRYFSHFRIDRAYFRLWWPTNFSVTNEFMISWFCYLERADIWMMSFVAFSFRLYTSRMSVVFIGLRTTNFVWSEERVYRKRLLKVDTTKRMYCIFAFWEQEWSK